MLRFAPVWKRMLSYLLDISLVTLVLSLLYMSVYSRQAVGLSDPQVDWSVFPTSYQETFRPLFEKMEPRQQALFSLVLHNRNLLSIINLVVFAAYFIILWAGWGQTLGNKVLKIAVIDIQSRPLNLLQSVLRYSGLLASQMVFYVPLLFVLQPVYRQRIHDFISGSVVVEIPDDVRDQMIQQRQQMENEQEEYREDDPDL